MHSGAVAEEATPQALRSDGEPTPAGRAMARVSLRMDARAVGSAAAVFVAYLVTARLSLLTDIESLNVAAIWLPAGVSTAALLLARRTYWPILLLSIGVAAVIGNLTSGTSVPLSIAYAATDTMSPLLAAVALHRVGFGSVETVAGVGWFSLFAIVVAPAVGGLIGAIAAVLIGNQPFLPAWLTWVFSDAGGVVTVAPLILVVAAGHLPTLNRRRAPEAIVLSALLLAVIVAAFGPWELGLRLAAYPIFLFLVLAAVRFGFVGASLATTAVAVLAYAGTLAGYGPMVQLNDRAGLQIGMAHVLVGVTFLTAFVTAAAMSERKVTAEALERERALEARRAAVGERVTAFAHEVARSLEVEELFQQVVREAVRAVPADIVWLTIAVTEGGGPHRVVAAVGAPDLIGSIIEPGDGLIGTVIRDGATVVRNRIEPWERSPNRRMALPGTTLAATGTPIVSDGAVAGTIGLCRIDLDSPFDPVEIHALEVMASLVAVGLTNSVELRQVHESSVRDELTGVPNRRYFNAAFAQLGAQRERQDPILRQPVSAIMFDLDHFGAVNKERGHATGDGVLTEFGRLLSTRLRRADVIARYGGEEFIAILVGTGRDAAVRLADEIRVAFGASSIAGADGDPIRCTVSVGVASIDPEAESLEGLLPAADVALSMAKRAGRNMVASA
ncbi:MAG TPA: diguanylate cyclase [Candidatus Limnocylindria bacterium]|nr:diguanylate cyclase [Candidatus Limnocylindria bacterium]